MVIVNCHSRECVCPELNTRYIKIYGWLIKRVWDDSGLFSFGEGLSIISGFSHHDGIRVVACGPSSPCYVNIPVLWVYGDCGPLVDSVAFTQFDRSFPIFASVDGPGEHYLVMDCFCDIP